MKLSELSPEQKTRLLAELDGFNDFIFSSEHDGYMVRIKRKTDWIVGKPYLTSYDAIIPLIQKLWKDSNDFNGNIFKNTLINFGTVENCCDTHYVLGALSQSPEQLCDAVLIATGKAEL